VEGGNYDAKRVEGMVNVPVNEQLALRVAFQTLNHNGYLSNGYDDEDGRAGRFQALWDPSSSLSIRLFADYLHLGGRGASDIFVSGPLDELAPYAPNLLDGNIRSRSIANYCLEGGVVVDTCIQSIDVVKWSSHLDVRYALDWGALSILPAIDQVRQHNEDANAPLPFSIYNLSPYDTKDESLELRFNDTGRSALKWVGGINLWHSTETNDVDEFVNPLTGPLPVFAKGPPVPSGFQPGVVAIHASDNGTSSRTSAAVFGQVTYPVTDSLRLTGGGRYTHDEASLDGSLGTSAQQAYYLNGGATPAFLSPPLPPTIPSAAIPGLSTGPIDTSVQFHAWTYRIALDAGLWQRQHGLQAGRPERRRSGHVECTVPDAVRRLPDSAPDGGPVGGLCSCQCLWSGARHALRAGLEEPVPGQSPRAQQCSLLR
jgi:outer membrane receptor protein involved in Fe transport